MSRVAGFLMGALVLGCAASAPAQAQWFHYDGPGAEVIYDGYGLRYAPRPVYDGAYSVTYRRHGRAERLVVYGDGYEIQRPQPRRAKARYQGPAQASTKGGPRSGGADRATKTERAPVAAGESTIKVMPVGAPEKRSEAPAKPIVTAALPASTAIATTSPAPKREPVAQPAVASADPRPVRVIEGVTTAPARPRPVEQREFSIPQ